MLQDEFTFYTRFVLFCKMTTIHGLVADASLCGSTSGFLNICMVLLVMTHLLCFNIVVLAWTHCGSTNGFLKLCLVLKLLVMSHLLAST